MDEDTQSGAGDSSNDLRPFKRRKFYRKRTEAGGVNSDIEPVLPTAQSNQPHLTVGNTPKSADVDAQPVSVPSSVGEILRQRKALQRRRGGIEFKKTGNALTNEISDPCSGSPSLESDKGIKKPISVVDRFAPQTGQVANVDQHMITYIESEMAKRRQMLNSNANSLEEETRDPLSKSVQTTVQRQPAALGKLHEVDLGPEATSLNISRTEAAKRMLHDEPPKPQEAPVKVRLGKDGKPRRAKRIRNSEDIKRDQLVEEVLRENKLDIYDEPEIELSNDDQAADDRIAEQFRREFMDAVSERRQKMAQPSKRSGPGAGDDKPKGPKLGGSRSARAAMRDLQEKTGKK